MEPTVCSGIVIEGRTSPFKNLLVIPPASGSFLATIDNQASDYELHINNVLLKINRSQIGGLLLREIAAWSAINNVKVTISQAELGPPVAGATNEIRATPLGKLVQNTPTFYSRRTPAPAGARTGTGKGSDSVIIFNSRFTSLSSFPMSIYAAHGLVVGWMSDEDALFHELIHARRQISGEWYPMGLTSNPVGRDFVDTEEFLAVLLTNIYMSENGLRVLRGSYRAREYREGGVISSFDSANFLRNHECLKVVKYFWRHSPLLFSRVSSVHAKFNPIREYALNRRKYDSL